MPRLESPWDPYPGSLDSFTLLLLGEAGEKLKKPGGVPGSIHIYADLGARMSSHPAFPYAVLGKTVVPFRPLTLLVASAPWLGPDGAELGSPLPG